MGLGLGFGLVLHSPAQGRGPRAQPLLDPLEDGEAVGLSVPRFAIVCTQDRAIGPTRQREMAESVGAEIFELPASHSPFYSMPERVVDLIDRIAHADAKKA